MRALILRLDESLPILPNALPRIIDRCSRRLVCCPLQIFVLLSTVQRLERGASRLGGARLSARSRVVRPLPPLVALALVCSRRPPISETSSGRRSPRTGTPTTHPGCDDMPRGGGVGGVVRLLVVASADFRRG